MGVALWEEVTFPSSLTPCLPAGHRIPSYEDNEGKASGTGSQSRFMFSFVSIAMVIVSLQSNGNPNSDNSGGR